VVSATGVPLRPGDGQAMERRGARQDGEIAHEYGDRAAANGTGRLGRRVAASRRILPHRPAPRFAGPRDRPHESANGIIAGEPPPAQPSSPIRMEHAP